MEKFRSLLDYAATDMFAVLFLTANGMEDFEGGTSRVEQKDFATELCGGDHLPYSVSSISGTDVSFDLSETGLLSHFYASIFRLVTQAEDGPELVEFRDYLVSFTEGRVTGFQFDVLEAWWVHNGKYQRESGPWHIQLGRVSAERSAEGALGVVGTKVPALVVDWEHPAGGNISRAMMETAIIRSGVTIDLLSAGPSVFSNPVDDMIFYSCIQQTELQ